jgi:hypothetical protein
MTSTMAEALVLLALLISRRGNGPSSARRTSRHDHPPRSAR